MSTVTEIMDQPSTWGEMESIMLNRLMNNDERVGQAYFNALNEVWPELAELVHATAADPFYADSFNDPRLVAFLNVVIPYFK